MRHAVSRLTLRTLFQNMGKHIRVSSLEMTRKLAGKTGGFLAHLSRTKVVFFLSFFGHG